MLNIFNKKDNNENTHNVYKYKTIDLDCKQFDKVITIISDAFDQDKIIRYCKKNKFYIVSSFNDPYSDIKRTHSYWVYSDSFKPQKVLIR